MGNSLPAKNSAKVIINKKPINNMPLLLPIRGLYHFCDGVYLLLTSYYERQWHACYWVWINMTTNEIYMYDTNAGTNRMYNVMKNYFIIQTECIMIKDD